MDFKFKISKIPSFWTFHLSGWLLFWLSRLYFIVDYYRIDFRAILWESLTVLIGFTLSIGLRYLYKQLNYRSFSLIKLTTIVILFSFFGANIWYLIDQLLDFAMKWTSLQSVPVNFITYLSFIIFESILLTTYSSLYFTLKLYIDWNTQKEQTDKANLMAQKAQLQLLRYQLNPHFLFNTLSSLRALVRIDSQRAETMITKISEFLRYTLADENRLEVPLSEELEIARLYLDIEKVRFGENLIIKLSIDPLAEDYPVPGLMLNPIIDNAVKYGMKTSKPPLVIDISAVVNENHELELSISNTGRLHETKDENTSETSNPECGTGTGLENVKKRLEFLYPHNHLFSISENENKVTVFIKLKHTINRK